CGTTRRVRAGDARFGHRGSGPRALGSPRRRSGSLVALLGTFGSAGGLVPRPTTPRNSPRRRSGSLVALLGTFGSAGGLFPRPTTPRNSPRRRSGSLVALLGTFGSAGGLVPRPTTPRNSPRRRSGSLVALRSLEVLQTRVEPIAQTVAEQVESEYGDHDCQTWPQHQPRRNRQEVLRLLHEASPRRSRRLGPESEVRQCGLGKDRDGEGHRCLDDEQTGGVRQYVFDRDPHPAASGDLGRQDVLGATDLQRSTTGDVGARTASRSVTCGRR